MKRNTREKLLEQAEILFSEKGFYGTSIHDVAAEVSVSKQGLLHHFPSKEKLYAAVMERAAEHLVEFVAEAKSISDKPQQQLLNIFTQMSTATGRSLRVIILLLRELLDNRERAEQAHKWYMRPFLDDLVQIVELNQTPPEQVYPLAFAYQLLGATQYYLISQPTLRKLYSNTECDELRTQHLALLERHLTQG